MKKKDLTFSERLLVFRYRNEIVFTQINGFYILICVKIIFILFKIVFHSDITDARSGWEYELMRYSFYYNVVPVAKLNLPLLI